MTRPVPTHDSDASLTRDLLDAARPYVGGRRGLFILAGIAVVAGLAFNWSWLAAIGAAPILLAALPCAAMCGLGLCMNRIGGRSCPTAAPRTPLGNQEDKTPSNGDRSDLAVPMPAKTEP